MEELVARVAAAADIPAEQARRAINLVLAFLKREAPGEFDDMQHHLPGAQDGAEAGAEDKPTNGGMMGSLMGKLSGGGGLMGLASQLTGLGLNTGEMTTIGKEVFAFARERAGDEKVEQVAHAIPGLGTLM